MTRSLHFILLALAFLIFFGCSHTLPVNHTPIAPDLKQKRKLVVFLDGTHNDESSHTSIAKLHNLVTLQDRTDIHTTYIVGVGTGAKVIGMGMGWGIGRDVREAYLFLARNYRPERRDEVYLFGFSRGAYAARILAGLLYTVGIPDLDSVPEADQMDFIEDIYSAFKGDMTVKERRQEVQKETGLTPKPVTVRFMGLWDTVEALGWPDYEENFIDPNLNYVDQLCNVDKAAHAVSIDDDRARIFTPILLTHSRLVENCKERDINDVVEEVWFAGAHADIGGGYNDTDINGVSFNWMLNQIAPYNLVPANTRVYADPYGRTHDPESGWFRFIYRNRNRNLAAYALPIHNKGKLKMHQSVFDRLEKACRQPFEFDWKESEFAKCFDFSSNNGAIHYLEEKQCFDVIDYKQPPPLRNGFCPPCAP